MSTTQTAARSRRSSSHSLTPWRGSEPAFPTLRTDFNTDGWHYCSDTNSHPPFPVHPWRPPLLALSCDNLPPYPLIRCPARLAKARRHISLVKLPGVDPTSRDGNVRRELASNKTFELMGDSYLKAFVLDTLMDRYPDLTASSLAKLITSLVANPTISWIAWHYGVFGADRLDVKDNLKQRSVWDTQNASADLFEAYLGGLVRDGGTEVARVWIASVYSEKVFNTLNTEVAREREDEHTRITAPPPNRRKRARNGGADSRRVQGPGLDVAIGFFLAGKKTSKANGATRFIPGSHLWPHEKLGGHHEEDCVYAELNPGDAFMMLASAQHGGSANTTSDEERLILSCFMTKGLFRQEENQYLTHTLEQMRTLPVEAARVVGYNLSTPSLGWVAFDDPIRILHPEIKPLEELY
ncbi:hypothetical protein P7C70_g1606, partial [Phenoliferia sp. Uapishka_3]